MKLENIDKAKAILLVEGLTEQYLLPYFALNSGLDLLARGIFIVPAGGVNKIVRKYEFWRDKIKQPIFCLFDSDASLLANNLAKRLAQTDEIHILSEGEVEDLMCLDFLVYMINEYLAEDALFDQSKSVQINDFSPSEKRTTSLDKIWRERELGKFEKVKFAQFVFSRSYVQEKNFLSPGAQDLFEQINKFIERNNL